jgi:MFS transporter, PAT family, beta-lactamase induction signal transducer AmpG
MKGARMHIETEPSPRSSPELPGEGEKPSLVSAYLNRRVLTLAAIGFSCGVPLALTGDTLQQWLTDAKLDLTAIGWLTLVALPYQLKFIWAPAMDRLVPPLLGRRRGWMLITQLAIVAAIAFMAFCDPGRNLTLLAVAAALVAFTSASQDIVADAYRSDVLPEGERGPGASLFVTGYRIAMLASGAGILILVDSGVSWQAALLLSAGLMGVGIVATLLAENPPERIDRRDSHQTAGWAAALRASVLEPFRDFLGRRGGLLVLVFVLLFRLPDQFAGVISGRFLRDVGLSKTDIATIRNAVGIAVTIAGAIVGGGMITRLGLRRSLWAFATLQVASNAGFLLLATAGASYGLFVGVIVVESFCGGLVTAGFFVFLMNQCRMAYSATQYALLSSLFQVPMMFAGPLAAMLVERLGYFGFFATTIACGVPGLLLLPWIPTTPAGKDQGSGRLLR